MIPKKYRMKHVFLSGLFVSLGLLVAIEGLVRQSKAATPLQTSPGGAAGHLKAQSRPGSAAD